MIIFEYLLVFSLKTHTKVLKHSLVTNLVLKKDINYQPLFWEHQNPLKPHWKFLLWLNICFWDWQFSVECHCAQIWQWWIAHITYELNVTLNMTKTDDGLQKNRRNTGLVWIPAPKENAAQKGRANDIWQTDKFCDVNKTIWF